jgi:type II secretion system protein G
MSRTRAEKGFTLIELLIVVGIIGLLATIGVWNYLIALDRGKQKRTITDIKTIATAWEQRAADLQSYNAAGAFAFPQQDVPYAQLTSNLTPTYLRSFPQNDGWGRPFDFAMDAGFGGSGKATTYAIRSRGRDGQVDSTYVNTVTTSFDCDIVYSNSAFIIYPTGESAIK